MEEAYVHVRLAWTGGKQSGREEIVGPFSPLKINLILETVGPLIY